MKPREIFLKATKLDELVAGYSQCTDEEFPRLRTYSYKASEPTRQMIAPAALLAKLLLVHCPEKKQDEVSVLVIGSERLTYKYEGRNFNYSALMSGFECLNVGIVDHKGHALDQCTEDTKNRLPVEKLCFDEASNRDWDFVLWSHPRLVAGEDEQLIDFASRMVSRGITVYGAMLSELDALVQAYGVSQRELTFNWIDSSITNDITEESKHRFGIRDQFIESLSWGTVITKLEKSSLPNSQAEWGLVRAAMTIHEHDHYSDVRWDFGERIPQGSYGAPNFIGLIGHTAISPTLGQIIKYNPEKEAVSNSGSIPITQIEKLPKSKYELLPRAASILLSNVKRSWFYDDDVMQVIEDRLDESYYGEGVVDAGIALANLWMDDNTDSSVQDAFNIYADHEEEHYLSQYMLGVLAHANGHSSEGKKLIIESSLNGYLPAMNLHGCFLMEDGDADGAFKLWHKGRKYHSNDAMYSLGLNTLKKGDRQLALKYFTEAAFLGHKEALQAALALAEALTVDDEFDDVITSDTSELILKLSSYNAWKRQAG